jgi:hypothetical protein
LGKTHFFLPKHVCFCDGKPTLAANILKNKCEMPHFLFDPSRKMLVLRESKKKCALSHLFFEIPVAKLGIS